MTQEMNRLVPDYYVVTDLLSHEDPQQLTEEEFRLRAPQHFNFSEQDVEIALVGEKVLNENYLVAPGWVDNYSAKEVV